MLRSFKMKSEPKIKERYRVEFVTDDVEAVIQYLTDRQGKELISDLKVYKAEVKNNV